MVRLLYSFVVPIYNVQDYLSECLSSIQIQQNLFECILVDDGSTDLSGDVARKFCEKDNRFTYYKQTNQGVSSARNFAISKAKGMYIICVDSDDVISPNFLQWIDLIVNKYSPDMVCFKFKKFQDNDMSYLFNDDLLSYKLGTVSEVASYPNYPWSRIAKKSLYTNNMFPVGLIYEDSVTIPILISKSNKVLIINNKLYGYRVRKQSLTNSSAKKQFEMFDALKVLKQRCKEYNIPMIYYHTVFTHLSRGALVSLSRLADEDFEYKKKLLRKEFKSLRFGHLLKSFASPKDKLLAILIKIKLFGIVLFLLRTIKKTSNLIKIY